MRRLISVVALLAAAGCGAPSRPTTVPVSGKVTWNGQPLTKGTVSFVPANKDSFPASGPIDSSGKYTLTTFMKDDGAMPGDYAIAVSVMEGADEAKKLEGTRVLPDKYYRAEKSGLTASIKPDEASKTVDLALEGKR